ncbi:MAG: hypothetical protein GWM90_05230, partial [Gemmatimonadetes bacterium]|nr:hypothetical protein [Gemmatimonadota bacterium]NIQ53136.1 hypothetical protein [Gemmatimonadota bacterium]NIU73283.1 hypothetical protein [Gammaproteobacteria bacterium]NIX43542.1 hypothetical protein [Gemmatimonadota bacterium]NIY07724.1 hypothetical protein [Gemmatimonadota bacterium]
MMFDSVMKGLLPLASALMVGACMGDAEELVDPVAAPFSVSAAHGGPGTAVSVDPGGAHGVNTAAVEGCPIESPNGQRLFFASDRAGGEGGIDIWVAHRDPERGAWIEPENLPAPVNSAFNDFCPTPLPGGVLLFVSSRPGGCGEGTTDIYRTRHDPAMGWLEPEHLGCEVNSAGNEFSPSYVGAGGGTLFFSSDRNGGPHEVFASARRPNGGWGTPVAVTELNAPGYSTARPNVSPSGLEIVFDSDRPGGLGGNDIWTSTRASVFAPWSDPMNAGAGVNSAASESRPTLSRDGRR